MTDTQQFILALATLIIPTAGSIWAAKRADDTHKVATSVKQAIDDVGK